MRRWLRRVGVWAAAACWLLCSGGGAREAGGAAAMAADPPLAALTFDDGPRKDATGRLLEGLALREVPATFFLVGCRVAGNEELLRTMAAGGHQIGIHTYDHTKLAGLDRARVAQQLDRSRAELTRVLGPGDYWLRPPYGLMDRAQAAWAGSPLILWSVDPEDWRDHDAARIAAAVLDRVQDGDIILLHDIYQNSVDAALAIADGLLARGYCLVTVEQLFALRGVEPENGVRYCKLPLPAG